MCKNWYRTLPEVTFHLLGHLEKSTYLFLPISVKTLYQIFLKKLQRAREETISEKYYTWKYNLVSFDI